MLKVIDLFSGIGGFALGLQSTGYFKTIQFVENEKWCQKILAKNFPGVPIHEDVKTFQGYGADVVVGGFPCQPFSVAGKQKATKDDRHLWPDMFRVIKETKPTWVIGENVRNIVSISDGMVLEQVYLDLESQGYEVQSFIIPASAVNAPHQRYRTWIVAHSECNGLSTTKIGSGIEETVYEKPTRQNGTFNFKGTSGISETTSNVENTRRTLQPRAEFGKENENEIGKRYADQFERSSQTSELDVAHTRSKRFKSTRTTTQMASKSKKEKRRRDKSSFFTKTSSSDVAHTDSQRGCMWETDRQDAEDVGQSSKCQISGYWDSEPNVGRVVNGLPNRVDRLRGLGNAIVPQIAYQIGKAIMEAEDGEPEG